MTRRKTTQKTSQTNLDSSLDKVKWYVLRGFNVDDNDNVGFLGIDKSGTTRDIYKIVEDLEDAMKFPSKNVYSTKGFGTPQQWLEFFKTEPALCNWKFHLVKVCSPKN